MRLAWDALWGRRLRASRHFRMFPALQPLDLHIGRGESVAVVGRNGSGKSTLLQLIARTLKPSSGEITVNGRLSALLELGSGFNPDFTGLENIYLNGAILGLSRARIEERLDDILAFADIGSFVEQPVRTYSSGMRMRLAFAVITAVDPEILIIDEALSVGDAFFQSSCARWLEEYVDRGNTFLCVSHDMFMIKRLCQRGIVLDEGKMVLDAPVSDAANHYYKLYWKRPPAPQGETGGSKPASSEKAATVNADGSVALPGLSQGWHELPLNTKDRTGDRRLTIERLAASSDTRGGCLVGDWIRFRVDVLVHEAVEDFNIGIGFRDRSGQLIGGYHSFYGKERYTANPDARRCVFEIEMQLNLKPQVYLLVVGLAINRSFDDWEDIDCLWDCSNLAVSGEEPFWGLTALPVRGTDWRNSAE